MLASSRGKVIFMEPPIVGRAEAGPQCSAVLGGLRGAGGWVYRPPGGSLYYMYTSVGTTLYRLYVPTVLASSCYAVLMFMAVRSEAQSQGIMYGPMRTGDGPHGRHPIEVP